VGLFAPDGSIYVTQAPGDRYVGVYAPDGSIYVTDATADPTTLGRYAADGSLRVRTDDPTDPSNEFNGAIFVEGISFTP
jgi:hypothetical protein